MRDCKRYKQPSAQQIEDAKRKIFQKWMKDQGWEYRRLFMQGGKWTKDGNEILLYRAGYCYNKELIAKEALYSKLGYTEPSTDSIIYSILHETDNRN